MKKILVLGATGAMGNYLVPELAQRGYFVDAVSLDDPIEKHKNVNYIKTDALDIKILSELLANKYDAVVDFMIYSTAAFAERFEMLLGNTSHYIFLSSYRIYADEEHPIRETSPRLLDVSNDREFISSEDYALYKAREENIIRSSKFNNWTIIRPAITYSKRRFQLVTLEANVVVHRAMKGLPVLLPKDALGVRGTMSWAGDVGKMIARLVLNQRALKEIFTVSTSEHNTWETVAGYYKELINLEYIPVDSHTYLECFSDPDKDKHPGYQLFYDRCFDRIIDNSKILDVAGMKQSELMPLKEGLRLELEALPENYEWPASYINDRMDNILKRL